MNVCQNCGRKFKYPYLLLRHLTNVNLCSQYKNNVRNTTIVSKTIQSDVQTNTIDVQTNTIDVQNDTIICKYCQKNISRKDKLKIHEERTCRLKDDPIRIFELQLNKSITLKDDLFCRFCNEEKCNKFSLMRHSKVCKKKIEYRQKLEEEIKCMSKRKNNTTIIYNNYTTIDNSVKKIIYNKDTRCLISTDPDAPCNELLCYNGFERETMRFQG